MEDKASVVNSGWLSILTLIRILRLPRLATSFSQLAGIQKKLDAINYKMCDSQRLEINRRMKSLKSNKWNITVHIKRVKLQVHKILLLHHFKLLAPQVQ